jgi:hypothetical protein
LRKHAERVYLEQEENGRTTSRAGARSHEVQDVNVVLNRLGEWEKRPTLRVRSRLPGIHNKREWLSILASMTGLLGTSDLVKVIQRHERKPSRKLPTGIAKSYTVPPKTLGNVAESSHIL